MPHAPRLLDAGDIPAEPITEAASAQAVATFVELQGSEAFRENGDSGQIAGTVMQ